MDEALRKEQLSMAYIRAVAACAGFQVVRPEVDDDSVDGIIMADFGRRPRLEIQAKATSQDMSSGDHIRFPLKVKNYNELLHRHAAPKTSRCPADTRERVGLADADHRAAVPASLRVLACAS